ncbi:MAG: riboflavin kinase [Candidatus Levybacteria bacterium]|nr:riboflavin kinase [Candidatus Levybacteria bacterium]
MNIIQGKVRKGKKRGKALGFPTANIPLHKNIPEGVYVSKTKINGDTYNSITFIGRAKTFNETKYQAETFIFSFERNIYNKWITINLLKKIRDNKKFKSSQELVMQIKRDEKEAKEYFEKNQIIEK